MGFFRILFVERIFLKWNQAEADRLRSWFKLVDPTFKTPLWASPDWRYIAPKWREQSSMRPFPHHQHLLLNKETKKRVRENQHFAAVECLYYATHYQFNVDVQASAWRENLPVTSTSRRCTKIGSLARNHSSSRKEQWRCRRNQHRKPRDR